MKMNLNVLFITSSYLSGNEGGIYASRTHINLFANIAESMTLLYPYKKNKEPEYICKNNIEMIPVEDNRSILRKGLDFYFGKLHRFSEIAKKYIDSNRYNLIVFDSSVVSSRLISFSKKRGLKIITIHHNYQIEYLLGDCSLYLLAPSLFWNRIYEKQAVRFSDINITLTNQDAELLSKHYDKNANFAVLGVFEFQTKDYLINKKKNRGNKFIITGGLASKQTEDSLIPWIVNYYPILKKINPNIELTIAGRDPSEKLCNVIKSSGINLIASPPDMFLILQEQDYYICPTDRGGGLKLRIMDGFKAGLPVLTHSVSARGYEKLANAGMLFQYEDVKSFEKGVRNLLAVSLTHEEIQNKYNSLYNFSEGIEKLQSIVSKCFD